MRHPIRLVAVLVGILLAACASRASPPSVAEAKKKVERNRVGAIVDGPGDASAGRELFVANCSPCHGEQGRGDGPAADSLEVPPRDLTSGRFKFTSTRPGEPPTDGDLYRTLSQGVPGTGMPAWSRQFDARQIWNLVQYVKRLSPAFAGDVERHVISISDPPATSPSSVRQGEKLYEEYGCVTCHGVPDRDRPRPILTDHRGRRIEATQFGDEALAGGDQPRDVYRCIAAGIGGTPMPAFYEALEPSQIWHLVHYVRSL